MRQPLDIRSLFAMAASLVLLAGSASAQTSGDPGSYAIVDVRVEVGDGRTIDKATIVIKDGLIKAVGADVKAPPDAIVIKGEGLVAYPGFIDAGCQQGLKLPEWQPDQDKAPDISSVAPATMREANRKWVRPELRARDCLALSDTVLDPLRRNGFCVALVEPSEGLMAGMSTVAMLDGAPSRDSIVRGVFGEHFSFSPGVTPGAGPRTPGAGGSTYPGSLMGIIADLRQTLIDGLREKAWKAKADRGESIHAPADDALESLSPVLDGTIPVVFTADSRNEIHRALTLADEFHLKLIVSGGGDAWKETKALANRNVPVIASLNFGDEPGVVRPAGIGGSGQFPGGRGGRRPGGRFGGAPGTAPGTSPGAPGADPAQSPAAQPPTGQPPAGRAGGPRAAAQEPDDTPKAVIAERHAKWEERASCPAKLEQAKIPFAFTSAGLRSPTDFFTNLRHAIKNGLSRQAALKALTVDAAHILGVARELGSLEVGKAASIVVMTGDFAEPSSRVKYLIIDHSKFEPDADQRPAPAAAAPAPADDDRKGDDE